jgi:hypothetical protein
MHETVVGQQLIDNASARWLCYLRTGRCLLLADERQRIDENQT